MTVITRFAPSPTGNLHVGSIRTALYAWLYAKHNNGKFILRIEDTDGIRSTDQSVQAILEGMKWLGLDYEEGPIYQSQRISRYKEIIEILLANNCAYKCTCSQQRLQDLREQQIANKQKPRYDGHCRNLNHGIACEDYVIRFKTPEYGSIIFEDLVYGTIEVNQNELDDLVLLKSDGNPTYNFAVVVDDLDMHITHVIRGDDHLNNTPRQINIYNALNAKPPIFAHLPMILGDDGKRLSKRHGAVDVLAFKRQGYLPETILNYLVRLGWSHKDQEIFSTEEMISLFDLSRVHRGCASFDYDKLKWLNHIYMKNLKIKDFEIFYNKKIDRAVFDLYIERSKTMQELSQNIAWLERDTINYDQVTLHKIISDYKNIIPELIKAIDSINIWHADNIQLSLKELCNNHSLKLGQIGPVIRFALTGSENAPALGPLLASVSKKLVIKRLNNLLA